MSIDVEALLKDSVIGTAKCLTCVWLAGRPDAERDKWDDAIEQPKTFAASQIARAMTKVPSEEKSPTTSSVLNHRNGHPRGRISE